MVVSSVSYYHLLMTTLQVDPVAKGRQLHHHLLCPPNHPLYDYVAIHPFFLPLDRWENLLLGLGVHVSYLFDHVRLQRPAHLLRHHDLVLSLLELEKVHDFPYQYFRWKTKNRFVPGNSPVVYPPLLPFLRLVLLHPHVYQTE